MGYNHWNELTAELIKIQTEIQVESSKLCKQKQRNMWMKGGKFRTF